MIDTYYAWKRAGEEMKEAKATPPAGRYYHSIERVMNVDHHAVVCDREERPVLALCGYVGDYDDEESRAMCHLFAAAPEMLRALEKVIEVVRQGPAPVIGFERNGQRQHDFNFGWNSAKEQMWNALGDALTAIAKAKAEDE